MNVLTNGTTAIRPLTSARDWKGNERVTFERIDDSIRPGGASLWWGFLAAGVTMQVWPTSPSGVLELLDEKLRPIDHWVATTQGAIELTARRAGTTFLLVRNPSSTVCATSLRIVFITPTRRSAEETLLDRCAAWLERAWSGLTPTSAAAHAATTSLAAIDTARRPESAAPQSLMRR